MARGLKKETIFITLDKGLDTSVDPKVANQGTTIVENGVYRRQGAIEKRSGQDILLSSSNAQWLGEHKDNLMLIGTASVQAYDNVNRETKTLSNNTTMFSTDRIAIPQTRKDITTHYDVCETGSIIAAAYRTRTDTLNGTTYGLTIDLFNKHTNVLEQTYEIYSGSTSYYPSVKLLPAFGSIYAFYATQYTTEYITSASFNINNGILISSGSTPIEVNQCMFDVNSVRSGSNEYIYFVAQQNDHYSFGRIDSSGNYVSSSTTPGNYIHEVACWAGHSQSMGVAYIETNGSYEKGYFREYDFDAGIEIITASQFCEYSTWNSVADTKTLCGASWGSGSHNIYHTIKQRELFYYGSTPSSANINWVKTNKYVYSDCDLQEGPVTATSQSWARHCILAGRPFQQSWNGTQDQVVPLYTQNFDTSTSENDLIGTIIFVDENAYPIGKHNIETSKRETFDTFLKSHFLPGTYQLNTNNDWYGSGERVFSVLKIIQDYNDDYNRDQFQLEKLYLTSSQTTPCVVNNKGYTIIGNSCPYEIDGTNCVEQGFLWYPDNESVYETTYLSGNIANGTYNYICVYEWLDAQGNLHRSAHDPDGMSITTDTGSIKVNCKTLSLTLKNDVSIGIYRTQAGPLYPHYRIGVIENVATNYTASFEDTYGDNEITSFPKLYTAGGVLENTQPKPYTISHIWDRRQFYVDANNPRTHVYYSKWFIDGRSIEHSDSLVFEVNHEGGNITALADIVDKLLIFKRNQVYAVEGTGLNNLGQGTDQYTAYLINPAVGCDNIDSVIRTKAGVLFQAADGLIYLCDAATNVSPVGQAVRYYTDQYTITSAEVLDDDQQIIFTTNGPALIYNFTENKWSVFDNYDAIASKNINGTFYRLTSAGNLYTPETSVYYDDESTATLTTSSYVFLDITTGWFVFPEHTGIERVYKIIFLGQNIDDHKLEVSVGYNFSPNWHKTYSITPSTSTQFDYTAYYDQLSYTSTYSEKAYLAQLQPVKQKCSAIRLRIKDCETTKKDTRAYSITGVGFVVGVKHGGWKSRDERKIKS